jgi:hypothetical protein
MGPRIKRPAAFRLPEPVTGLAGGGPEKQVLKSQGVEVYNTSVLPMGSFKSGFFYFFYSGFLCLGSFGWLSAVFINHLFPCLFLGCPGLPRSGSASGLAGVFPLKAGFRSEPGLVKRPESRLCGYI